MPENEFSSRNNGRDEDAAQNHKHLDALTAGELADALSDMWDAMDECNYDSTQMDAYLAELEKREPISSGFDVDASLAAFHEKHAQLFEQGMPVQILTTEKPIRRWHIAHGAAIAAAILLCSMVTAQALGFDVFRVIARWTEETFHFSTSEQSTENKLNPLEIEDGKYTTLAEALDACGITFPIEPQWYPEGFESKEITVVSRLDSVKLLATYQAGTKNIVITIRQYSAPSGVGSITFEKDAAEVISYEKDNIMHYIMANNERLTATWIAGEKIVCSISGNLTIEQIEHMIDSIYEG
ncbi:DUF4367 domain-containing protein [Intestinimonas butyriciproducens]|uniref:DUF4367 domain-containing protein n=1 Tax=Intestinimonas butyriciproducens TaxID=1297617 RepID=UPI00189EB22C|nr:DUF4367 domain-containing protein [Intestinimonas butyriciproducens]